MLGLNDSLFSNNSILYTLYAVSLLMKIKQAKGREELKRTYEGRTKMMGGKAERPGKDSNSTTIARLLDSPISRKLSPIKR
jgi:hypothetical protein